MDLAIIQDPKGCPYFLTNCCQPEYTLIQYVLFSSKYEGDDLITVSDTQGYDDTHSCHVCLGLAGTEMMVTSKCCHGVLSAIS